MNVLQIDDIGKIIQLSIAPVFLLTGVGTQLVVLTNRLARIIDRSRILEEKLAIDMLSHAFELDELYTRSHLINRAIALSTFCALMVCLIIATLFLEGATNLTLSKIIAAMFVLGILSLTGSYLFFLREIFVATRTLERDSVRRGSKIVRQKRANPEHVAPLPH
jgi:hypothetical protein